MRCAIRGCKNEGVVTSKIESCVCWVHGRLTPQDMADEGIAVCVAKNLGLITPEQMLEKALEWDKRLAVRIQEKLDNAKARCATCKTKVPSYTLNKSGECGKCETKRQWDAQTAKSN